MPCLCMLALIKKAHWHGCNVMRAFLLWQCIIASIDHIAADCDLQWSYVIALVLCATFLLLNDSQNHEPDKYSVPSANSRHCSHHVS